MYLPYWIDSGFIKIKDIKFINGQISEKYIWTKLTKKSNYRSKICQIKSALKHIISTSNCNPFHLYGCDSSPNEQHYKSAKQLYLQNMKKQFEQPRSILYFRKLFVYSI